MLFTPPQYKLPLKSYHTTPLFLTEMAKGLRLVSKAVKLGCQHVDLVLDSYKSVGMLICYIPRTINPLKYDLKASRRTNDDDDAFLLPRPPPCLGKDCCPSTSISVSTGGASSVSSACSSPGSRTLLLRIF